MAKHGYEGEKAPKMPKGKTTTHAEMVKKMGGDKPVMKKAMSRCEEK